MNEEKARNTLDAICIDAKMGRLANQWNGPFCEWTEGDEGVEGVFLEGRFRPDELEALAWWMRNKGGN